MCHRDEVRWRHSHIQPTLTARNVNLLEIQCRRVDKGWVCAALAKWTDPTRVIARPALRIGDRSHASLAPASGLSECFQIHRGQDRNDRDHRRVVHDADQRLEHLSRITLQGLGRFQSE